MKHVFLWRTCRVFLAISFLFVFTFGHASTVVHLINVVFLKHSNIIYYDSFVAVFCSVFTIDYLIWRRKDVINVFHRTKKEIKWCDNILRQCFPYCKRWTVTGLIIFTLNLSWTVYMSIRTAEKKRSVESIFSSYCFECNQDGIPFYLKRLLFHTEDVMMAFSCCGVGLMLSGTVGMFCMVIRKSVAAINLDIMGLRGTRVNRSDVIKRRIRYAAVQKLLLRVNTIISPILFFWFSASLLNVCRGITAVLEDVAAREQNESTKRNTGYINSNIFYLLFVAFLSCSGDSMNNEFSLAVDCATELSSACENLDHEGYCEVLILLHQLAVPSTSLMMAGYIAIDKKLLLSYVGTVLTYTIIFAQMNPHIQRYISSL